MATCRRSLLLCGTLRRRNRHGVTGTSVPSPPTSPSLSRRLASVTAAPELVFPGPRPDSPTIIQPRPALAIKAPPEFTEEEIKEYFIPITRCSIVRYLLEEPDLFTMEEKLLFERFAAALDGVVWHRFTGVQDELKRLFNPLDPGKHTMFTKKVGTRDSLDQEFWLLQKLSTILERANFFKVSAEVIQWTTRNHKARGIVVDVDLDKYAVLQVWALGRELAQDPIPWYERWTKDALAFVSPRLHSRLPPRRPQKFLRRVIAATRLKADDKLHLKAYRDIPADRLELLLPHGKIRPLFLEKALLATGFGLAIGGAGILVMISDALLDMPTWPFGLATLITAPFASYIWYYHLAKKTAFLGEAQRTQFAKHVASNRGLIEALVDRAQAETFKEALLTYTFALKLRQIKEKENEKSKTKKQPQKEGVSQAELEEHVVSWAKRVFDVTVNFDSSESIHLLERLRLIQIQKSAEGEEDRLFAHSLVSATNSLPDAPASILLHSEEGDALEGYDKDIQIDDLLREEKHFRRLGWR